MACTNQWAQASPTRPSMGEDDDAEVVAHVKQLIVDLLLDDGHSLAGAAAHHAPKHDNPEEEASARERLLEHKLAKALIELAGEQDNLRLAANAGNALLEQLRVAREEIDTLHDELEAAHVQSERSERDLQRLRDQNKALENELQRYDVPYGAWESWDDSSQLRRRLSSRSRSFNRSLIETGDACELCATRETQVVQLEQRADESRRRCLELELVSERDQQRIHELDEEIAQLKKKRKEQQLETVRVQHELDFVTSQVAQRAEEVESVQAARDALRRTVRRLEAESDELQSRLAAREELVAKLELSKARATTQIQVAENRAASAQAEAKRVTEALQQLQKQLDRALEAADRSGSGQTHADAEAPQEKEARDMEQLLADASREVTALRLENRILRRQSSDTTSDASHVRGRRRQTLCIGSAATTAAEVLALDRRAPGSNSTNVRTNSPPVEPATTAPSQLPPLEIDTVESSVTDAPSTAEPSGDGKRRRRMSLELKWVDPPATSGGNLDGVDVEEKADPREGCSAEAVANSVPARLTLSPTVVKRPGALSRHLNDHCVIGGATKVNASDIRLYSMGMASTPRRERSDHGRVRELPIEDLKKAAVESPPKSPLVLGLSFIACATAATAAGLLVRR